MALKLKIDKAAWEGLEEGFRELYTEKDGEYILGVEGLEDTSGLKSALEKERADRAKYEKDVKEWAKFGKTREEIQKLIEQAAEAERKELERKGEWDKLREQLVQKHTAELEAKNKELAEKDKAISAYLIDSRATEAIAKNDGNARLLLPHVKGRCRVVNENGKYSVQVLTPDGSAPMVDSSGNPLSIEDFVKSMRDDEDFQSAFKAKGGTGSGSKGGGAGAPGKPHTISRADARAHRKYLAAKEAAEKAGASLEIVD